LPAAVVLGGDPLLMLAAILPLPEDFDELGFAGFFGRSDSWFEPSPTSCSFRPMPNSSSRATWRRVT
jgi:3-polyprenyl-4-hydroxybenzoate decarboxylase